MRDLRVLIVDDEPAIARALRPALEGHGFAVVTASSGAEAIARVAAEEEAPLQLILLDLGLPDIDGVDLAARLRRLTGAPIIVLSVRGADRDKIAALDNGADDYLTKPFSIGELMARVRVALRRVGQAAPASAAPQPIAIGGVVAHPPRHPPSGDKPPAD